MPKWWRTGFQSASTRSFGRGGMSAIRAARYSLVTGVLPLPGRDRERDARGRAEREHGRPGLARHGGPAHVRVRHEDERACGGVDLVAADGERGPSARDEVELLVPGAALVGFGVLLDDVLARVGGNEGVDAERLDAEVMPDGLPRRLPRLRLVERLDVRQVCALESSARQGVLLVAVTFVTYHVR